MILVYGLGALVLLSLIAYFYNCNESARAELRVQNDKKDSEDKDGMIQLTPVTKKTKQ